MTAESADWARVGEKTKATPQSRRQTREVVI
jgi:hypothetical protein